MPDEMRVHDAFLFETFSGPDLYVAFPAGLFVCFETHNGIRV